MKKTGAKVLAVAGPKGGVSKTTTAINIALNASRRLGLRVLLVDSDPNRSALDVVESAGPEVMPFDAAPGLDDASHDALAEVHGHTAFDLVVADLPGADDPAALRALLTRHGRPVVDALVFPTPPDIMDLRPLLRQITQVIQPLGLPYLLAITRVHPHRERVAFAHTRQHELREQGITVADTITRDLTAHRDAVEQHTSVIDMSGGRRSSVRAAEREYLALSREALALVGIDTTSLTGD
jgi:cellulose biosynthesis protein BcsQ